MSSPTFASTIHLSNPSSNHRPSPSPTYIIYFITGNPGLIEYYRTFLTHLYSRLTSSPTANTPNIHIYGRSLSGFETSSYPSEATRRPPHDPPYSLQEQIATSEEELEDVVGRVREEEGSEDVRVILMGHSLGTYISMEILRRQREMKDGLRIVGAILLCPTITDLAKSPNGRKSGVSPPLHHSALPSPQFRKLPN
jgi:pimeloyl-ACP methyl ester carboxylesterase